MVSYLVGVLVGAICVLLLYNSPQTSTMDDLLICALIVVLGGIVALLIRELL